MFINIDGLHFQNLLKQGQLTYYSSDISTDKNDF